MFRALFGRLPDSAVLVFDNYQEAPAGAALHEVLREAIAVLPPGIKRSVFISRTAPPAAFAREIANDQVALSAGSSSG